MSVLVGGHLLEITFVQRYGGDPAGIPRVRYYDANAGADRVKHFPVADIAAVDDAEIREIRALMRNAETVRRKREAAEKRILKNLLAGAEIEPGCLPPTSRWKNGGKKAPRLHVRKRWAGEKPPPVQ